MLMAVYSLYDDDDFLLTKDKRYLLDVNKSPQYIVFQYIDDEDEFREELVDANEFLNIFRIIK
jgi:hypothetical protein